MRQVYFLKKFRHPADPDCGLVTKSQTSVEDSFAPDAENRPAAPFVKSDVLLESRRRLADYRRRDAAHNFCCRCFSSYSRTAARVLSLRLRQIADPRQTDTHDIRRPCRDEP